MGDYTTQTWVNEPATTTPTSASALNRMEAGIAAALRKENNLADLASAETARGNLGLGSAAVASTDDLTPKIVPDAVEDTDAVSKGVLDEAIETAVPSAAGRIYVMDPATYDDSDLATALGAAPDDPKGVIFVAVAE